jgi:hypothetical protein
MKFLKLSSRFVPALLVLVMFTILLTGSGCASAPYRYGQDSQYVHGYPRMPTNQPQIVTGRPSKFLDACDWIWPGSLLGKLVLWNYKVDSHEVSTQTVAAIQQYLVDNDLRDVKVRINGYQPGDEWRRTFSNYGVGGFWRYTLGFLTWLQYTALPGRFFGGDHYNPYANTINIYSDIIPVALHEGGHSKDFAQRTYKGTYSFLYIIPFFSLYPEAIASTDALSYLRAQANHEQLVAAYKILYPAYGTYVGGNFGRWIEFPWNYAIYAAGVIPGHIVGRIKAANVPEHLEPQPKPVETPATQP